jgi:hypothetical protein
VVLPLGVRARQPTGPIGTDPSGLGLHIELDILVRGQVNLSICKREVSIEGKQELSGEVLIYPGT